MRVASGASPGPHPKTPWQVIPKPGGRVRVVNGAGRGCVGEVAALRTEDFCVDVRVDGGGQLLKRLEYEDVCKISDGDGA